MIVSNKPGVSWSEAETLTDNLDTEIRNLVENPTSDNAVCLVRSVMGACRATSQTTQEYPETLPCPVHLEPGMRFGKGVRTQTMLKALQRRAEYYAELDAMTPEERAKHDARIAEFKSMLPQPVPVVSGESASQPLTDALCDVIAERQRQISVKGWTPEHDDTYIGCELAAAAISYIEPVEAENYWPADWHDGSFRPSDYRRNLVKATALLLAELERLDRISATSALSEVPDGEARED